MAVSSGMTREGDTTMKFRTLVRHIREAFRNIWRNGWMTFASISTVSVTLLILGAFVLLALNLDHITGSVEKTVEIRLFLKMDTTDDQIKAIENEIRGMPEVSEVVFVPREQGLEELKKGFGEEADLFAGLEKENPLPDAFVVKTRIPQETGKVAELIAKIPQVEKVRYARDVVERLFKITDTIRNVGIVLIIGLAFTAMFLIANTIKLTILSRSREIEIMKLVGATNGFIRWPFFIEGSLLGMVGALLPLAILLGGYQYLYRSANEQIAITLFVPLLPIQEVWQDLTLLLIGLGILIGIWGTITSIRRFLRV